MEDVKVRRKIVSVVGTIEDNPEVRALYEELFDKFYHSSGKLYWKHSNKESGCVNKHDNYRYVKVLGKLRKTHRMIFLMLKRYLPKIVDHIDQNRLNNIIYNLRPSDSASNQINRKKQASKSGVRGVYKQTDTTWVYDFSYRGVRYKVKGFESVEEARAAHAARFNEVCGEFTPDYLKIEYVYKG